MRRTWVLVGLLGIAGCLPLTEERTTLVGGNPFNQPTQLNPLTQANYSPASKEVALRVDQVGQQLVQANPQLGFRPFFAKIGSPRLELFHTDLPAGTTTTEPLKPGEMKTLPLTAAPIIYITEGLVLRCSSDAELMALLSFELGRILSEREANSRPAERNAERLPPIQVPIGNAGAGMGPDLTAMAELGKFEKRYPKDRKKAPSDPRKIAASLMEKAGFPGNTLENVEPLLREADHNAALERQFKGGILPTWSPE